MKKIFFCKERDMIGKFYYLILNYYNMYYWYIKKYICILFYIKYMLIIIEILMI